MLRFPEDLSVGILQRKQIITSRHLPTSLPSEGVPVCLSKVPFSKANACTELVVLTAACIAQRQNLPIRGGSGRTGKSDPD